MSTCCTKQRFSTPRPDDARLRDMLDAARTIVRHTAGRARDDLDSDEPLALALTKAVEMIGEAARGVTPETRARAPEIPWKLIVGARHKLIHEYFRIDRDLLWRTVSASVPDLVGAIEKLMASMDAIPPADPLKPSEGEV